MVLSFDLSIEYQVSILLLTAFAGYLIASKINQSAVVGEILLGIAIGPSLLGLVSYSEFVRSFAHVGAIVLLLVIGFEFRLKDVFNPKYAVVAVFGVVIPWVGGFVTASLFAYDFATAVFIGTALTATSVAITANILSELGKLRTEAARAILGAAVIDDILGLMALTFSVQIQGGDLAAGPILVALVKVVAFLLLAIFLGRPLIRRLVIAFDRTSFVRSYPETTFLLTVIITFVYALLADVSGLSAIVGAFLAGATLEGLELVNGVDIHLGSEYLRMAFAPLFFVSLGILVNVQELTIGIAGFVVVLTIIAFLTKLFGCYLGSRLVRIPAASSLIIGIGMAPRGEVAMIVALIGLNLAIINHEVYFTIILVSLLTTLVIPIILRRVRFPDAAVAEPPLSTYERYHRG